MDRSCNIPKGMEEREGCVLRVHTEDVRHNVRALRKHFSAKIIAVIKNNGYGLGLIPTARILAEEGVDALAVAAPAEALQLAREEMGTDILCLTPVEQPGTARRLVGQGIVLTVGSREDIWILEEAAREMGRIARVHVKVDTGFGRYGFLPEEVREAAQQLRRSPHLAVEGAFTHCGRVRPRAVRTQYEAFVRAVDVLREEGAAPTICHFAHSALALADPKLAMDALRLGSALLGRVPGGEKLGLRPVGQLQARVSSLRVLPEGSRPGYGGVQRLRRPTRVAVVEAGWQDGFALERPREHDLREWIAQGKGLLQGRGRPRARFAGEELPVLGRGGMHFTLLDGTESSLRVGDWVTLPANPLLVPREVPREYL